MSERNRFLSILEVLLGLAKYWINQTASWEMPHVFTNQITDISEGFFFDVWDRDQGGKVSKLAEVKG